MATDRNGMFQVAFTPSAFDDINWFRQYEQNIIFDKIEEQLRYEPDVETRNKKRLRPNQVSEWELRVETFRVFYDVDAVANAVEVRMVCHKEGNKLLVRGKEYAL